MRKLTQPICLKCENLSYKIVKKFLNSLFFKQILTPTFRSRKEKWNLWNASPKKAAESLETFCLKSKQKLKAVFFQESFLPKSLSGHVHRDFEKTAGTFTSDEWESFAQSAKKWQIYSFFPKKNICPQTKFWTGKVMLLPFLTKKTSFKIWYLQN